VDKKSPSYHKKTPKRRHSRPTFYRALAKILSDSNRSAFEGDRTTLFPIIRPTDSSDRTVVYYFTVPQITALLPSLVIRTSTPSRIHTNTC